MRSRPMKELVTERVLAASVEMPGVSLPLIRGGLMVRSGGCYCDAIRRIANGKDGL
jgi:hypothetical protein